MDRTTIASRASSSGSERFYKSYVKNIKLVEQREIPHHMAGWFECDYTFDYKGNSYKVIEKISPNKDGDVKYSAKYTYSLEKIN